jgi:hypothetical protein
MVSEIPRHVQDSSTSFICPGDSLIIDGNTYFSLDTSFTILYTPSVLVDSTVSYQLFAVPSYTLNSVNTSCNPNDTGTVIRTYSSTFGCDSIVTEITTLLPSSRDTFYTSTCDAAQAGVSQSVYMASNGCDSVITEITTHIPPVFTNEFADGCDSVQVLGQVFYSTGTAFDTLAASSGCDSIIYYQVQIYPSVLFSFQDTFPPGQTYTLPNGQVVDSAGTYSLTYQTQQGCDSTLIFTLVEDSATGALLLSDESWVKVYPNPTSDLVQISFSEKWIDGSLQVYDAAGKLVTEISLRESQNEHLKVEAWAAGTYTLVFRVEGGQNLQQSLVVR